MFLKANQFFQVQKVKEEVEAISNPPPQQTTEETQPSEVAQEKSEIDIDLTDPDVMEAATKIQVRFYPLLTQPPLWAPRKT